MVSDGEELVGYCAYREVHAHYTHACMRETGFIDIIIINHKERKENSFLGQHLGHKSTASTERYSHLSAEETLETGAAISKKLYG